MHCAYKDLPPAPHPDSGPTRGAELINKANGKDSPSDLAHLWVVCLDMNLSYTLRGRWMCGLYNRHHVLYWCLQWTTIYCSVFLSLKQHFAASKGRCNTLVCWSQPHLNIPMFKSHTWGWGVVAVAYFGLLCDRYNWHSWISTLTLWLFSICGIVAPHFSIHLCPGNVTCGLSCCYSAKATLSEGRTATIASITFVEESSLWHKLSPLRRVACLRRMKSLQDSWNQPVHVTGKWVGRLWWSKQSGV